MITEVYAAGTEICSINNIKSLFVVKTKLAIYYKMNVRLEGGENMNQKKIGDFIAALRKEKEVTQQELGNYLGVTNKTVSRWETGKYMPDIAIIPELCKFFGISINEFICGERVEEEIFRKQADMNIIDILTGDKKLRRQKQYSEMLGGAGTGLILSVLYNPDRVEKAVVAGIGLLMIITGWYLRAKIDKSPVLLKR